MKMMEDYRNKNHDKKIIPYSYPTWKDTDNMRKNIYNNHADRAPFSYRQLHLIHHIMPLWEPFYNHGT